MSSTDRNMAELTEADAQHLLAMESSPSHQSNSQMFNIKDQLQADETNFPRSQISEADDRPAFASC